MRHFPFPEFINFPLNRWIRFQGFSFNLIRWKKSFNGRGGIKWQSTNNNVGRRIDIIIILRDQKEKDSKFYQFLFQIFNLFLLPYFTKLFRRLYSSSFLLNPVSNFNYLLNLLLIFTHTPFSEIFMLLIFYLFFLKVNSLSELL